MGAKGVREGWYPNILGLSPFDRVTITVNGCMNQAKSLTTRVLGWKPKVDIIKQYRTLNGAPVRIQRVPKFTGREMID